MKRASLIILLLISLPLFASGQYFDSGIVKKKKLSDPVKIIMIYSASVILDAVGDGLNDDGNKGWGHACNALSTGLLLTSPFIIDYERKKWGWYLASYVCLRIATFDYSYNLTRGLGLNYIGGTSFWDKTLKKLNPPNTYLGRAVFLTVGISIPINNIK